MAANASAVQYAPVHSGLYVFLVASVAAISGLLFGFDTAVINGALLMLRSDFALSDFQTEIAASALLLGCLIGASFAGTISDRLGRKRSLLASAMLFAASSAGSAVAGTLAVFCAARLAGGLAIGLASAITPVYIAEVAPAKERGRLGTLNQLAIVIGILVAYLTNWKLAALGTSSWRWMFAVGVIPSIGFLAGLAFIPESPRWMIARGRVQEGRSVLERIAGKAAGSAQFEEIQHALGESHDTTFRALFRGTLRKRVLVAIGLAVLQQISGINTVLYYGAIIFQDQFGGKASSAIGANVLVGLINFVFTLVAMYWIDKLGRRALLLTASGGMAVCLGVLALALRTPSIPSVVAFSMVLLYVAFFAVGLGPTVWVYISEIFPTQVRGRAASVATTALWTACLAVTFTFLSIVHAVGASGAFLLYAVLSAVTFAFVWYWVPETRGSSLEELEHKWDRRA